MSGCVLENVPDVSGTSVFVSRDAVRELCHACRHEAISTEALCHANLLVNWSVVGAYVCLHTNMVSCILFCGQNYASVADLLVA